MLLGRYRLLAQLGAGVDGTSYRGVPVDVGDEPGEVVVVDLSRARGDGGRWPVLALRLRLAARIEHPAVVQAREADLDGEHPHVTFTWPGAPTLAEVVSNSGPWPRTQAVQLAAEIAAALEIAHRLGLSHGRIGPGQIAVVDGRPQLDFLGVDAGFPPGSSAWRALDAACRDPRAGNDENPAVDRAADIYALGVLVGWLTSGRMPALDPAAATEPGGLTITVEESDPVLSALIRLMVAADPADRPSAREVRAAMAALIPAGGALTSVGPSRALTKADDATGDWTERAAGADAPTEGPSVSATVFRPPSSDELLAGSGTLGRYRLVEKLGEGGQGVVFRAEDTADGRVVAIKVLRAERAADPNVLRRFRKEARLMAEANNPEVVNLLEFNEEDGIPYLVLEFISGEGLDGLLRRRGRFEEFEALEIMAGVARGLASAHERGIIHRDVKPSNVLLLPPDSEGDAGAKVHGNGKSGHGPTYRIKLTDFGLARHVVDTESMALTAAGALLGTPHYMAPEQWTGRAVDARVDVYAMGVTLYHLLAGRTPFTGSTREALASQHCEEPPPPLSKIRPNASEGLARVVDRAMAKRPEDRYIDAAAMLRDLEALRRGEPTGLPMHPILPDADPRRVVRFEFRWDLDSPPRPLWPLVTDTDRLDRAIGFPALKITTVYEEGVGVRTFAEGRKAGMVESGEEFPYEWVEPRRMGVLRRYDRGPFLWVVSAVELRPRAGGGTTLIHRLAMEPRTWLLRVGSRWGVGRGLRKALGKVYQRIDATLQGRARRDTAAAVVDPFQEPDPLPSTRRKRLERLLERLEALGVAPAVVERLGDYLVHASPQEVARIRPIALAERFGLDPDQVIVGCLHGAREGLLELYWDLLCPVCRISCQVTDTLRAIAEHAHCTACHLDFELDFTRSIELIFRVHPEIRQADLGTYCIGGPSHSPHVPAQVRVGAGERLEVDLNLTEGQYRLRGPQLPWSVEFAVVGGTSGSRRWEVELLPGEPPAAPSHLRSGGQVLMLDNRHGRELVIRVERVASRADALTAARATTLPLFRELFPGETLAPGRLATVSTVTLLVADLEPEAVDALYQDLGDAAAFETIRAQMVRLEDGIRRGGGAVIKEHGEGLLASFSDVAAAARVALEFANLDAGDDPSAIGLRARVGLHRGAALAAAVNDQLDYFGATARVAARTLDLAVGGDVVFTPAVAEDPEVAAMLSELELVPEIMASGWSRGAPDHLVRIRPRLDTRRRRSVPVLAGAQDRS